MWWANSIAREYKYNPRNDQEPLLRFLKLFSTAVAGMAEWDLTLNVRARRRLPARSTVVLKRKLSAIIELCVAFSYYTRFSWKSDLVDFLFFYS